MIQRVVFSGQTSSPRSTRALRTRGQGARARKIKIETGFGAHTVFSPKPAHPPHAGKTNGSRTGPAPGFGPAGLHDSAPVAIGPRIRRSEERRVGKECRSRW